jgi:hypothetical protein
MRFNRAIKMYGDKLEPYTLSVFALLFGMGWICEKYWEIGFNDIFPRISALFIVVYFIDAIIKSILFIKEHLKLKITCKH